MEHRTASSHSNGSEFVNVKPWRTVLKYFGAEKGYFNLRYLIRQCARFLRPVSVLATVIRNIIHENECYAGTDRATAVFSREQYDRESHTTFYFIYLILAEFLMIPACWHYYIRYDTNAKYLAKR